MNTARAVNQRPRIDVADALAELIREHPERTRYVTQRRSARSTRSKYNVDRVPSLLHQLEKAGLSNQGDDRTGGGFESRYNVNIEALDTLRRIDTEATAWLEILHLSTAGTHGNRRSLTSETTARLRRLFGALSAADPKTKRMIETDFRRWHTQARVVTGWDEPAWRPDNTCPMCDEHGSLRVKRHEKIALCIACAETWDPDTIGLLAEHIRLESDLRSRRVRPIPPSCYCPLPKPEPTTLRLCPACGSARCIRALRQQYEIERDQAEADAQLWLVVIDRMGDQLDAALQRAIEQSYDADQEGGTR